MISYPYTLVVLSALDALVCSLDSSLHIWVNFEKLGKAGFLAILEQLVTAQIRKPTRSIVDELTVQPGSKLLQRGTFATGRCALTNLIPIDAVEVADVLLHAQLLGRIVQPKHISARLGHAYSILGRRVRNHLLCPLDQHRNASWGDVGVLDGDASRVWGGGEEGAKPGRHDREQQLGCGADHAVGTADDVYGEAVGELFTRADGQRRMLSPKIEMLSVTMRDWTLGDCVAK
jgi:hypothetical protein